MSLSGTKSLVKTMDIKTAFLISNARKRKASSQESKSDSKNLKLSPGYNGDSNEILEVETEDILVLESNDIKNELPHCKKNNYINRMENEDTSPHNSNHSLVNEDQIKNFETANSGNSKETAFEPPACNTEFVEIIEHSSSDEHNSSAQNSSINVSLNSSGISLTANDINEGETGPNQQGLADSEKSNEFKSTQNGKELEEKVKKRKKMTPEEAKRRAEEREKKLLERDLKRKELEEKKQERLLEKERKQKERQLRKEQEEQEKKEKERLKQEKKEQEEKERLQKQKEKEEKNKLKQMLLEQKLEEKKKKEELRLKREEELKKAEEKRKAKLEKEQKEKEKREKAKAAFVKFFVKDDVHSSPLIPQVTEKEGAFLPFQVSDDMILAPVVPPVAQERFNKDELDYFLQQQDGKELYLQILKSDSYQDVRQRKRAKKLRTCEADVIPLDRNGQAEIGLTAKLLQFHENIRPPYWGTWRKKSMNVRPCNPFGEDDIFDYSVDSDDEWDEGGPGESLSGTEQEDESEDDYEVDNEFFVPHGYLSAEEEKEEDDTINDPEKQKALLKIKLQEFEMERKKKTTELRPIILGCFFVNDLNFQDSGLQNFLQEFATVVLLETDIPTSFTIKKAQDVHTAHSNIDESADSIMNSSSAKRPTFFVPEKAMPDLIRLVHGNCKKKSTLAEEFQKFWYEQVEGHPENAEPVLPTASIEIESTNQNVTSETETDSPKISKRQLHLTIKKIAVYGKCPDPSVKKFCWWVHPDIREKYGMREISVSDQ